MTNEQRLKKCIEKAVVNGWENFAIDLDINDLEKVTEDREFYFKGRVHGHINEILFDHSFCKAFWGEKLVCSACGTEDIEEHDYKGIYRCNECDGFAIKKYKYEIRNLAGSEDRLKYMEQFIK